MQIANGMKRLSKMLVARRQAIGWSLDRASRSSGISRSTIQRIEHGDTSVTVAILLSYADALGVANALLEGMVDGLGKAAVRITPSETALAREELSRLF